MWIKICGIRDVETAAMVGALRPDAIGLNFFAGSARSVHVDVAAAIVDTLPDDVEPVGVFVNHTVEEIRRICEQSGIRTVQLHGDEAPAIVEQLEPLEVIRALRVGPSDIDHLSGHVTAWSGRAGAVRGLLVDAHVAEAYGGTGQVAPWEALSAQWRCEWPPLILAGGLTPENVSPAVRQVRPWGVDVASGVESSPGVKDLQRVRRFIEEARRSGPGGIRA